VRRRSGDVARFVSSMASLVLLAVGVPLALVAVSVWRFGSANPLSGVGPPWRWFADDGASTLTEPLADETVTDALIRLSLCVAWIAVATIVVTTVFEVVHLLRHRGASLPDVRGLGWAQTVARSIAVGMIVLLPPSTPAASVASAMSELTTGPDDAAPTPVVADTPAGARSSAGGTARDAAERTQPTHVVRPGESVYSIAETLAAATQRDVLEVAEAIVEANLDRPVAPGQRFTNPAYVEAGWRLHLPVDLAGSQARGSESAEAAGSPTGDGLVVVEPGDTLWDIAEEELGDPTAWTVIWEDNAGRDMGGGRRFDDPDLILPGWELRVDRAPEVTNDDQLDVDEPAVVIDTPPPTLVPSTSAPDVTAPSTTEVVATSTTVSAPIGGDSPAPIADDTPPPQAPAPVRLEHAALLAAGVLAMVGVRRRQRMRAARPRHRVPEPRSDAVDSERRLRAIDPGERTMRIDVACRAAAAGLIGSGAQIGWILASADGDVTLRLTAPAELGAPWSGHGHDWVLGAEIPVEFLSDDARRVGLPCVALFQLGVTSDGDDVLVDLEACGTLAVEAAPAQTDEITAAVAAGLASSIWAETAQLIGVSVPSEALLGHRNAQCAETIEEALRLATELVGTTAEQERSTFELRSLRTGGEAWEPAVVLVGSGVPSAAEPPEPTRGVALLVPAAAGQFAEAPVRLVGSTDGWRLRGFGATIDLTPIGLSRADLASIDAVLADAERPLVDSLRWSDDLDPVNHHPVPYEEVDHAVVVRLLGSVEVVDTNATAGRFERSKTVELIAWLSTHRSRSTRSGARAALWELDVRDATFANVVSEARRGLARLVTPPEGEEWVERTLTDQLPLHPWVVTDADLVEARLAAARLQPPQQALATLRPAVEMIRGMPFAGTGYLWPDAEGITSNLVLLAIGAAGEFAGHALSLGDTDAVFWATGRGLAVLSGHEELIGLRMRAHARAGDLAGVRQEWESYERVLVADAWSDGEPAPKLLALRHELLSR
jgi:nucleoid-associated protein YgaU